MTNIIPERGLYIQLYNIHGLLRGHDLQLGVDSDTGGQTRYVLDLAKALSERDDIEKVEIVTRLIDDKNVNSDYAVPLEKVNDKLSIVRIQAGGKKYIKKELLWPYMEEFVDKSIKYIKSNNRLPDTIHSHYADAGYVCTELTKFFGIPFIHTGHSLGRLKKDNLLSNGQKPEELERKFKFSLRIRAEENAIRYADRIITSTKQEITGQYSLYKNSTTEKFTVIPPAVSLGRFYPYNEKREWTPEEKKLRMNIRENLWKFFTNMYKPTILALCRPDKRKNISGLIQAYGEDKTLQEKANLAIYAGIRKDITKMPEGEREILTEMLLLMDKYNLYGKMAIPKSHDVEYEVPELYRIAAESQGVFVNSAYSENFGLTAIEAAASGLPVVVTDQGGPVDIIDNLKCGMLVDVKDPKNIADAINKVINDGELWKMFSYNGIDKVESFYSWEAHSNTYMEEVKKLYEERKESPKTFISSGAELFEFKKLLIYDIDNTMTGDDDALKELKQMMSNMDSSIGFGVATGRHIDSAIEVLKEYDFLMPSVIISSVGSEMYYRKEGSEYTYSTGWEAHISYMWKREEIFDALKDFDFLELQPEDNQRDFKVSYNIDYTEDNYKKILRILDKKKIKANIILSHGVFLDILPYRASKGRAVRYQAYRWNIPHENILVAGDSGNDTDMLTGELLGVIVANYEDMEHLKGRRRVYFSDKKHAAGIIDGIYHYNFLKGTYDYEK